MKVEELWVANHFLTFTGSAKTPQGQIISEGVSIPPQKLPKSVITALQICALNNNCTVQPIEKESVFPFFFFFFIDYYYLTAQKRQW